MYTYEVGGAGTSIAPFLSGEARLGRVTAPPAMVFHEGAGKVTNTIPPGDYSSCELLNETVQNAPASTRDPELMGSIAAIGIVIGKPFPPTGYRQLDARSAFFYGVTGITPAMAMRLPGIGSQYVWTMVDADKNYLDGGKTYKVTLPKGIPAGKFWSFTLYDTMTRSMLDTPQRYPRAGSQSYPSPAAEAGADGSTVVFFGPKQPGGVKRGNWIQTTPNKGFIAMLRLYSPLEPFFTQKWRPSEVELVK